MKKWTHTGTRPREASSSSRKRHALACQAGWRRLQKPIGTKIYLYKSKQLSTRRKQCASIDALTPIALHRRAAPVTDLRAANDFLSQFDHDHDGVIDASEAEGMARALARQADALGLGAEDNMEHEVMSKQWRHVNVCRSHRRAIARIAEQYASGIASPPRCSAS